MGGGGGVSAKNKSILSTQRGFLGKKTLKSESYLK